ncbi:hypothetical protein F4777DRAFT_233294 [Nemania sp. FL0916]|nr:hypothetical protein F4777DRAFT_233294 [Nemania sp. FL0916]
MVYRRHARVEMRIPHIVPPARIVSALHDFEKMPDNYNLVIDYEPKTDAPSSKDLAVIYGDPFFRKNLKATPLVAGKGDKGEGRWGIYDIWYENLLVRAILPFFSLIKRYLAVSYRTESGIRFRMDTPCGVVERGTFTVVERGTGRPYRYVRRTPTQKTKQGYGYDSGKKDVWGGDPENRSIWSDTVGEGKKHEPAIWNAQDDTNTGSKAGPDEIGWNLVFDCESEEPSISRLLNLFLYDYKQENCEHVCRVIIGREILALEQSQ